MKAQTYLLDGAEVDVLDLKTLLITRGINVPDEIMERFGRTHRLAPTSHPFACNCLLLPGRIPAHMFHIGPRAEFSLAANKAGRWKACWPERSMWRNAAWRPSSRSGCRITGRCWGPPRRAADMTSSG